LSSAALHGRLNWAWTVADPSAIAWSPVPASVVITFVALESSGLLVLGLIGLTAAALRMRWLKLSVMIRLGGVDASTLTP